MIIKTHIVVHHSASADHPTLLNFQAIRDYHVKVNGWRDIGYNFVLDRVGGRVETLVGRQLDDAGAHTRELNLNNVGIGVCMVGDYDKEYPAVDAMVCLIRLCRSLMRQFNIPAFNVIGHREAQAAGGVPLAGRKSCPGAKFNMDELRARLASGD